MDIERLVIDSTNNLDFLLSCISDVEDDLCHKSPAEGKWSIHEIMEHLHKTELAIHLLCTSEGVLTNRSPFDNILQFRNAFSDHSKGYSSPDFFIPTGTKLGIQQMAEEIKTARQQLLNDGKEKGWSETFDQFPHPFTGAMTRFEWAYFNIYHVDRHTHQIRTIKLGSTQ